MGFLSMPDPPDALDMAKATVSLWFRFPQEAMDSVLAHPPPRGGAFGYSEAATWPVLQWQMTLLSWGKQIQGKIWWWTQQQIGMDTTGEPPIPIMGPLPGDTQTGPMMPCSICLDFTGNPGGDAQLVVNLQGNKMISVKNVKFATYINRTFVAAPGGGGHPHEDINHVDASYTVEAPLGISKSNVTSSGESKPANVTADAWHHLLVSWNVTGSISAGDDSTEIKSDFRMYYALDDENHDKGKLPTDWIGDAFGLEPGAAGTGPNTIISNDSILSSLPWPRGEGYSDDSFTENATEPGSYQGTIGTLPARNMFVPGSSDYTDGGRTVNSVYKVEMAELQIFTGVMLDTSSETNRRAFLAPKEKSHDIASTDPSTVNKGEGKLFPVDPKKAEELLGKKPDILLHRINNWKKGKNTGSIGVDDDGKDIPSGQFTPTGTIKKYTPDPSIAAPSG